MDQIKIGQFIAQLRKEKGLTQQQLADKLLISNKTVSKWETGKGMPEISMMMPLCETLGISVNELLSGEKLSDNEYKERAEENMVNMLAERQTNVNRLVATLLIFFGTGITVGLIGCVASSNQLDIHNKFILIIAAIISTIIGLAFGISIDRKAGYFECTKCHKVFTPSGKNYIKNSLTVLPWGARFRCPHCNKTTYCKRRLTK